MIRSFLKKVVQRALGEPQAPKRPATSPATAWKPPPPSQAAETGHDHGHDHGHSHGHSHDHGHGEDEEEEPNLEVEGPELRTWFTRDDLVLIDVREPSELAGGYADGAILIPTNHVPQRLAEIPKNKKIVVYCAAGGRSFGVAAFLREEGFLDAWSLAGGFGALVAEGGAWGRPPNKAKFAPTSRVRITRDPLVVDGLPVPPTIRDGFVRAIREGEAGITYDIVLKDEAGLAFVIRDVAEGELARPSAR